MIDERVPGKEGQIAAQVAEAVGWLIGEDKLSFGGGTVLAARWAHRKSFDVDLFCEPNTYGKLGRSERDNIEKALHSIPGCQKEQTWCEDIATYTEIDEIETTILPRTIAIEPDEPTTLWGTGVALQSSAQILYAKITSRMYESGEITVRDAYDLAAARIHDPEALAQACGHTSPRVLETVAIVIEHLPEGWSRDSDKPLIEPRYKWSEAELQVTAVKLLRTQPQGKVQVRRGRER